MIEEILHKKEEKGMMTCRIGDVATRVMVSDEFTVNVMSTKFFEAHKIKCSIFGNSPVNINGHTFSGVLETRMEKNGTLVPVTFYFSDDIKEEKCIVITHIAKKLWQK